jgi:hypothetical protein
VDPRCALVIAEMRQYAYGSAGDRASDPREEPIKQNDHALVALRYLAWSELGQAPTTDAYLAELERMLRSWPRAMCCDHRPLSDGIDCHRDAR